MGGCETNEMRSWGGVESQKTQHDPHTVAVALALHYPDISEFLCAHLE